ncbi:MAG: hypothetical protein JWM44_14 [Bacilli bacterium]|nr:hypothetical protein [Bacilli bacterium]
MKMDKKGQFSMNRIEVAEFSQWLNDNPIERYKRFNDVVQSFMLYKQRMGQMSDDKIFEMAQWLAIENMA